MKYGYFVRLAQKYPEIRDLTLKVERLGFDSAHINDHFFQGYLEAMMLTSALAVETSKIKLGHVVLCNSFRNPAYLAKMVCTLDNISNGRALFWLGAGWNEDEYKGYGYPFSSAKQRVDELEESLIIYKKLFTERTTNFEGKFWNLEKNLNLPKPIQKPYPQLVLGTSGKRMTDIACRDADGINLIDVKPEELPEYINRIKANLKKYNRDLSEFEISFCSTITLIDNQEEIDKLNVKYHSTGNLYRGYPEDVKEEMDNLEELGIERMMLWNVNRSRKSKSIKDPLETFANKVMK
jgi:alkanesulfonate monooxygenase SsuD/methylene tetrahydromethanopterin reductase-like flavin-dependent oxidoreductase (luciferase family)